MIFHAVSIFKIKNNASEPFNFCCSCRSAESKYAVPEQLYNSVTSFAGVLIQAVSRFASPYAAPNLNSIAILCLGTVSQPSTHPLCEALTFAIDVVSWPCSFSFLRCVTAVVSIQTTL